MLAVSHHDYQKQNVSWQTYHCIDRPADQYASNLPKLPQVSCGIQQLAAHCAAGHTSWTTSGLAYLSLFLAGKLRCFDGSGHPWKAIVSMVPTGVAVWVGITRLQVSKGYNTSHGADMPCCQCAELPFALMCCAKLCRAVLCCAVVVPCCAVLCRAAQCCAGQHCGMVCCAVGCSPAMMSDACFMAIYLMLCI